ncbi:DUF2993 domain-containing protein [Gordonia sp. (in: high G+C Gram-positive bacteria)]|uniref:LmeA family phospholipid-binding protein n=1 Tax=Gordonia sp. (in: high G+C Gram-positive bacteria) TaxID=84139 RepID=UPI0033409FA2
MAATTRIHLPKRPLRALARLTVGVVILLVTGFFVDNVAASRAEHRLARALESSPGVAFEPEVTIGGFPFLARASSGRFPQVTISARGVVLDDGSRGTSRATLDARLTEPDLGNVWDVGPDTSITVQQATAETRVDSVNLGRLMGITDLYINTPAPDGKVGAGGPGDGLLERTDGIMLSGTVPLPGSPDYDGRFPPSASGYTYPKVKISVSARTFVAAGRVHIEATGIYDGPEEHYSADVPKEFYADVLKRFSAVLPPLPTAWNVAPNRSLSRGSDLVVIGEAGGSTFVVRDFARVRPAV